MQNALNVHAQCSNERCKLLWHLSTHCLRKFVEHRLLQIRCKSFSVTLWHKSATEASNSLCQKCLCKLSQCTAVSFVVLRCRPLLPHLLWYAQIMYPYGGHYPQFSFCAAWCFMQLCFVVIDSVFHITLTRTFPWTVGYDIFVVIRKRRDVEEFWNDKFGVPLYFCFLL